MLLGILSWNLDLQFASLLSISLHGNFAWLLRLLHMLGANFAVLTIFVHLGKAISFSRVVSPTKLLIWLSGSFIFLLSLATAFTGYVVVSGNMSFWAALVILNLLTVVPIFGNEIVAGVLGGSTVCDWSLKRFSVLHFLLAIISVAIVFVHLIILHRQTPGNTASDIADGRENLFLVLSKDLFLVLAFTSLIFHDFIFSLIHPDNWQTFSRLSTPAHIEPEIYFLWTFSIIKLHSGKTLGAAFQLQQA